MGRLRVSGTLRLDGFNESGCLAVGQGAKTHKDVRPIELAGLPVLVTRNKARVKSFCEMHPGSKESYKSSLTYQTT